MASLYDYMKERRKHPFQLKSDPTQVYKLATNGLAKLVSGSWQASSDQHDVNADLFEDNATGVYKLTTVEWVIYDNPNDLDNSGYEVLKRTDSREAL